MALAAQHERFLRGAGGSRAVLKFIVAPGVDGQRRRLNDADFTAADLTGARLAGCHLEHASLYCADLGGADLRSSNLRRADLRGASLAGASLNGAVLDEADMRAGYIACLDKGRSLRIFPPRPSAAEGAGRLGADFTNGSLRGASLRCANLQGANFSGAILEGADLAGARTAGAVFKDTVLTGLVGADLDLTAEQLSGCIFEPAAAAFTRAAALAAILQQAGDWVASGGKEGAPAVLDREDIRPLHAALRGRVLTGLSAREVLAIGMDFSGSELQGAVFDGADLRGAVFEHADLRGASFRRAKLSHARFTRADLAPLFLPNGRVQRTDFSGAVRDRTDFSDTPLAGLHA